MSLSQKNLSSIQKAGQATHSASEAIAATVRVQAQSMLTSVTSHPFDTESEQAIARFKMLARLSQGLNSVEAQLRELFAVAEDLASSASDVVIVLPFAAKHASSNAVAVDAVVKPAKAVKVSKPKVKSKKAGKSSPLSGSFTANDTTLLNYIQGALKADEWTRLTGGTIAAGSGLPLGSIGVSLKKIVASGAVKVGARGTYQLGSVSTTPTPETKSVKIKKPKPVPAKKNKSSTPPPQAPTPDVETPSS